MEDLYGTTPSSATGLASESEDMSNILNQLLQSSSSSSPAFSSAPSTIAFTGFKAKYAHLLQSPPPQPFSGSAEGLLGSEVRLRFGRSENRTEPEPSSGFGFADPNVGFFGSDSKEEAEKAFSDANASLKGRRVSPENDLGDFSCDSEGPEGSDAPSNSAQQRRSSSKRSRAAEVHNLSEKRRRSRINEKMKALQNLIPNSNKTDKASMLDEAIEYLKQLQLQVQMLSMRNGVSLHPVCLPGLPHSGFAFNDALKFPNPGIGIAPFSSHEDALLQSPYNLSNNQIVLPPIANVPTSQAPLGFEQSPHTHFRPVNLNPSSTELIGEGKTVQVRSNTSPSKRPDV